MERLGKETGFVSLCLTEVKGRHRLRRKEDGYRLFTVRIKITWGTMLLDRHLIHFYFFLPR